MRHVGNRAGGEIDLTADSFHVQRGDGVAHRFLGLWIARGLQRQDASIKQRQGRAKLLGPLFAALRFPTVGQFVACLAGDGRGIREITVPIGGRGHTFGQRTHGFHF